jgi:RNA polymerase-binding protein DksA
MDQAKLAQYERTLSDMRDRLTGDANQLAESIQEEIQPPGEVVTMPTHNADHDSEGLTKDLALEQNETDLLAQVVDALERIREGEYGECTNCGRPISEIRLDAIPYTPYCRECQEQFEAARQ